MPLPFTDSIPSSFIVAQLGSRMHYAVPRILHRAGMLKRFYTDICGVTGWPRLLGIVPPGLRPPAVRRLLGRVPREVPRDRITAFSSFGLEYVRRWSAARNPAEKTAAHLWGGQTFCRLVLSQPFDDASGVYTFNSAGLELLESAREKGLFRVTEQTIAPAEVEDQLLAEDRGLFPGWEPPRESDPHRPDYAARERAEWECADLILCGSEFVRQGIAGSGGPVERCAVVPYGIDSVGTRPPRASENSRLRVLVAGAVGLRKGAPYVLEAACASKGLAEFRWCGGISLLQDAARQLGQHVDVRGIVPRSSMREHYAWADIFLLPSICEGSATVCYEALAASLPVITTPNAGSVVRDGIDGFVVPIRDAEAIIGKLDLLARDRELLSWMSANATSRSSQFTVEKYGEALLAAFRQGCAERQAVPHGMTT